VCAAEVHAWGEHRLHVLGRVRPSANGKWTNFRDKFASLWTPVGGFNRQEPHSAKCFDHSAPRALGRLSRRHGPKNG
jgi:hypothetical protein